MNTQATRVPMLTICLCSAGVRVFLPRSGKAGALHGAMQNGTPFQFSETNRAMDHFGAQLREAGYNYVGSEPMYSGITGEELRADIFIGLVYYQRLRHMVSDKSQVRATGPVNSLTRQPIKGRKVHGGIRFGEMERGQPTTHTRTAHHTHRQRRTHTHRELPRRVSDSVENSSTKNRVDPPTTLSSLDLPAAAPFVSLLRWSLIRVPVFHFCLLLSLPACPVCVPP